MTTIMMRSAVEFHSGKPAPPDLHSVIYDYDGAKPRVVTWADVMEARRERQARILENRREVEPWRAWRLSVWWSPGYEGWMFRGYWAWLDRPGEQEWLRYPSAEVMDTLPLVLPMGDEACRWEAWIEEFLRTYPAGRRNRHPRAARVVWRRGYQFALKPGAGI